jgi:hypothetical protein
LDRGKVTGSAVCNISISRSTVYQGTIFTNIVNITYTLSQNAFP